MKKNMKSGEVTKVKNEENNGKKKSKREFPFDDKDSFMEKAVTLNVKLADGVYLQVPPKMFSTGSVGWYGNGKAVLNVDGKDVPVQIGLNITAIGSKEAE